MSITEFQRTVCRVIAANRIASGESYVAGGIALNTIIGAHRFSTDIDVFHDTQEAMKSSWESDTALLESKGYSVQLKRLSPFFIESDVSQLGESVIIQWAQDSAYRFFPLQQHPDFGLSLHPFDLATNKTLALIGRLEVRDWIDILACNAAVQPLGYLMWAASGKDPGLSPLFIVEEAARSSRYTQIEVDGMEYEGPRPSAAALSIQWKAILKEAREVVDILPASNVGACVLDTDSDLLKACASDLKELLAADQVRFHEGCLRGAYPVVKPG